MPSAPPQAAAREAPEQPEAPERPERPERPSAASARDGASALGAAPQTARELAGLRHQRDELTQQLVATHARRGELVREMESTDAAGRGVLRQQLAQLDYRVLLLEKDMTSVDHAIASAAPSVAGEGTGVLTAFGGVVPPRGFVFVGPRGPSANVVPILLLVVLVLQLLAFVGRRTRRAHAVAPDPLLRDAAARLARVEQAVEAIAIEVERVSEGQRFITRVLGPARSEPAFLDGHGS